jgi:glycerophosphoryl diester phosphodiesterase
MKKMEFIVSSFDWNALKEVSLANSAIPIGVLTETDLDLAFFRQIYSGTSIHPYFHLLTAANNKRNKERDSEFFGQ